MLLMIDNYDSFTYNLVQYLGELGEEVKVLRNDEITLEGVEQLAPARIVISPGPCTPNEAGISVPLVRRFAGKIPILGVCLGHQASGRRSAAGSCMPGSSCTARRPRSTTTDAACSAGCPTRSPRRAIIRWRSSGRACPDCLEVSAWSDDGEIMGVRHKELAVEGVQFHPESILTEHGHELLQNFLESPLGARS